MTAVVEDIYRSSNGDRWTLVRDTATGRMFVRHHPNEASGGRVSETDVDAFLAIEGTGPEHVALRKMLERVVANDTK